MLKQILESLYPMGSGDNVEIKGKIKLPAAYRNKFSGFIKENYYNTLSEITSTVISALEEFGLRPIYNGELWSGAFTGAMSDGDSTRLRLELEFEGKEVTNSMLILNIQKDNGRSKPYELNTYLS
jgi:hypothetical protein